MMDCWLGWQGKAEGWNDGGKKNGEAMCMCMYYSSLWYLMMGTRRLLGRAAERIAGRERLVSWLFRWLGWDGLA
jgi:hypothetical protein